MKSASVIATHRIGWANAAQIESRHGDEIVSACAKIFRALKSFRSPAYSLRGRARTHPKKIEPASAQAGRVSAQGPLRHGHLCRQGARSAQAREPVFSSLASHGLGFEIQR